MPDLELSWRAAAILAGCLAIAAPVLRRAGRPRVAAAAIFTQETALVLALFALWQFAGSFAVVVRAGSLRIKPEAYCAPVHSAPPMAAAATPPASHRAARGPCARSASAPRAEVGGWL